MAGSNATRCAAVLLMACLVLISVPESAAQTGSLRGKALMTEIYEPRAAKWKERIAANETDDDVAMLLKNFDKSFDSMLVILDNFKETRIKDEGVRRLANWGIALSEILDLPGGKHDEEIYDRLMLLADRLLAARQTSFSYIEQRVMRGWPMYVDTRDSAPSYDGFNFGYIGIAIANAAREAAIRGHHAMAHKMVEPVFEALYDGFLTDDPEMRKLNKDGIVVYVPDEASDARKLRHKTVTQQDYCLGLPQAYNHGLLVARAGIAVLRAFFAIDWTREDVQWGVKEISREDGKERLKAFARQNAYWLRSAMAKQPPTGSSSRDKYPGKEGSNWVKWQYRDYTGCNQVETYKDRWEDTAHATHEVRFINDFREWAHEEDVEEFKHFDAHDVQKIIRTFLNRVVYDYDAPGGARFACDVNGVYDDSGGYAWKQCGGSRVRDQRAAFAMGWLPLVKTVRQFLDDDKDLRCDAMQMVDTTLPLALPGEDFDPVNFGKGAPKWAPYAIQAKYYFYNYKKILKDSCEPRRLRRGDI